MRVRVLGLLTGMALLGLTARAGAFGPPPSVCLPTCAAASSAQAGECRYLTPWSEPGSLGWGLLQYADLGACASVRAVPFPAVDGWQVSLRMDCREATGSDAPVAYDATMRWTFRADGAALAEQQAAIQKAPTTLCAGGGFLQLEVAWPGATELCAATVLTKQGAPYRTTDTVCTAKA